MKKITFLVIACFLFSIPNLAICDESTGNVNLFWGTKQLDEDDCAPTDEHDELGILVDYKEKSWPVSIAISYLSSSDEQTADYDYYYNGVGIGTADLERKTTELSLGIRKIWDGSPSLRPYIGCGIALISAEFEASALGTSVSDDDTATGFWIAGGIYFTISESFNVGFEYRLSQAEVTLFDVEAEAGGTHTGLLFGFHW